MHIKLRLTPCVFSFRHTIIVLVFCLLTFTGTFHSSDSFADSSKKQETSAPSPEEYTLPIKDAKGNPTSIIDREKREITIDEDGLIHISSTLPVELTHKNRVNKFIEDDELIRMPKNIVDKEINKRVSVGFSSKIAFDGVNLYVKRGTELKADHYKTVKVENNQDTIYLERLKTLYLLNFTMSDEKKYSKLFESMKRAIIVSDGIEYPVDLKWDTETNQHKFLFREGEEFEFKPIIDDNRICAQSLPYKIWTRNEKGVMEGKCPIELNPFNLIVTLTGEDSKKISSVKLISSKQQGTSEDGQFMGDQERKVRFVGLEWGKAPYEIRTLGTNCYSAPIGVDFDKDFEKLSKDTPTPVLTLEQPVWSYIEKFGIQLASVKPKHIRNIRIGLTEPGKIPAAIKKNRDAAITDENGFVLFNDVYDWRNITLSIGEDKEKREIGLPAGVKMTSGDKRIDLYINLDELNK